MMNSLIDRGSTSLVTAMNAQIESLKPEIREALDQARQARVDLNAHMINVTTELLPKVDQLKGVVESKITETTDRMNERVDEMKSVVEKQLVDTTANLNSSISGVTEKLTDILESVGGMFKSTVKTAGMISKIMDVITSISSVASYYEDASVLHAISALWSIWKVIKICLDLFPSIKDMAIWKETAEASFDEAPEVVLREQAGNGLLTGLGFAAVVTNFMPKWVIKTLELFSKASRYRVLEDMTWVGDAIGIILEVPAFIMNWVADNFNDVIKVSIAGQERYCANFQGEALVWQRFNEFLSSSGIAEKLKECAVEYQCIICKLPGTKLHRLVREAEALILVLMDDYRQLAEENIARKIKDLLDQLNVCVTTTVMNEGRIPDSIKETHRKLADLYRVSVSLSLQIRQVPVMVVLQGLPNCGKSYLMSQILARLRAKNGIYPYVNNNVQKDYNDLYAGQAIWVHEEIGRRGGSDYGIYIPHVSVMPSPLDAAELTRKQLLTFQSKLILGTTNDDILNKSIQFLLTDNVKEPEAVYRRILVVDCDQFHYDSTQDKYVPLNRGDGLMHFFKYNTSEKRYVEMPKSATDPNDIVGIIKFLNAQVQVENERYEVALKKSKIPMDVEIVDFNTPLRSQGLERVNVVLKHYFGKVHTVSWDTKIRDIGKSIMYINGKRVDELMFGKTIFEVMGDIGECIFTDTVEEYYNIAKVVVKNVTDGVVRALTSLFDKVKQVWMSVWDKYFASKPRYMHAKEDDVISDTHTYVKFVERTGVAYDGTSVTGEFRSHTMKVSYGLQIKNMLAAVGKKFDTNVFVAPTMYNYKIERKCDCCQRDYVGIIVEFTTDGSAMQRIWKWFMESLISHPAVLSTILLTLSTIGIYYLTRKYAVEEYRQFSKVNFPRQPGPHRRYNLRPQAGTEKLKALMGNTLRASVSTHGQTVTATIVMLDSIHALIPAHCLANADHTVCVDPFIAGENRNGQQMFKHWFEVLELDLFEDYALLRVKEKTAHIFPDIKSRFIQDIQSVKCVLLAGTTVVDISTPSKGDINSPYFTFRSGGKAVVTSIDTGFVYDYQEDGICGALISTVEGQVVGWHVATDDVRGYARPFKQHLIDLIRSMKEVQQTIGVLSDIYAGALPIACTGYRAIQKSSRIAPSKMQENMEEFGLLDERGLIERVPASLNEPTGVDVYKRGREKNLTPGKPVDRDALDFAAEYMRQMLRDVTKGKKLDVLTEREIVCGRDRTCNKNGKMSTLRRVEPQSSAGIPWRDVNGFYLDYEKGIIDRNVLAKMDYIEKNARAGIRVENEIIFKDCWKDELRVFDKQFKPRIFAAGPLHYTLLLRKYFGHLCELFMDARLETGVMIGINATSKEWDVLCKKLKALPNIFSGDYKSWDGAMVKEFQILLNEMLSMLTNDPKLTGTLLSYLYETQREGKNEAYLTTHSIPSGHGLTALYNSLINKMYVAYAWYIAIGKNMNGSMLQKIIAFKKEVYNIVYGDDLLVTVADRIKADFNAISYARTMDNIGLGFTTASKETVTVPFERMEDVTFLKRSFVFNKTTKTVTGPLEPYVLRSTIGWVNDPTLDEQLVKQKMDNIQRECFLNPNGQFMWGQMTGLFEKTYGYPYDGLREEDMLALYNRGELEADYDLMNY